MLRWCAYCQTSLGERAPFDDHSITHTVCGVCFDRVRRQCVSDLATEPVVGPLEPVVAGTEGELCKLGH